MITPAAGKSAANGAQRRSVPCIIGQPQALPTVMTMHGIELQ